MKNLFKPKSKLEVFFYRTKAGNEPVRDWLKDLPTEDKKILGEDIKLFNLAGL